MSPLRPPPVLSEPLLPAHVADPALRDRAYPHDPAAPAPRFHLDQYWADDRSLFARGFLFLPNRPINALRYLRDGEPTPIKLMPRPDLAAFYPDCPDPARAGFALMVPHRAGDPITFECLTDSGPLRFDLVLAGRSLVARTPADGPFPSFVARANRPGAHILEIGSRATSPGARPRAAMFPRAASFTGLDIHPGPGVTVVADAHALAGVFRPASFTAIYSLSVLEHLSAPWRLPAQIHAVLAPGGEVFHSVPFAFPLHEAPHDFWRFTHHGLAELFGPATGFELLGHGWPANAASSPPCATRWPKCRSAPPMARPGSMPAASRTPPAPPPPRRPR